MSATSASGILQEAMVARLLTTTAHVVGDGNETEFTLLHNLAMEGLPAVTVRAGSTILEAGTDYEVASIDTNHLQLTALDGAPGLEAWAVTVACLRVPTQSGRPLEWDNDKVPIVSRRKKQLANDIEAAAAKHGLGIYVMPSLPTRAMQGVPFVFFEEAEMVVRIIEQPQVNKYGVDAYELVDDIAAALQWQMLGGTVLTHPLQLASRPTDMAEDRIWRLIDVRFTATYGFRSPDAQ